MTYVSGGCALLDDVAAIPSTTGMRAGGAIGGSANGSVRGDDSVDDMFGTGRTYAASFTRPSRPTMISAKYKQKEERRKVLKISINKMKKIEDPESSLRRSVLINNTMRKLQRESKEDKMAKHQQSYRCHTSDLFKEDENVLDSLVSPSTTTSPLRTSDQLVDITNLPETNHKTSAKNVEDSLGCDESMPELMDSFVSSEDDGFLNRCAGGRKRTFDEVDDSEVQDVLSQFYLPPTPRMVTLLDEDEEDVNVVDVDTPEKRPRLDGQSAADRLRETAPETSAVSERRLNEPSSFSCGHSSLFNELQTAVYHNLVASLET